MTTDGLSNLLSELEYLEGITVLEFDSKDWTRFYRFVENRAKETETGEKINHFLFGSNI